MVVHVPKYGIKILPICICAMVSRYKIIYIHTVHTSHTVHSGTYSTYRKYSIIQQCFALLGQTRLYYAIHTLHIHVLSFSHYIKITLTFAFTCQQMSAVHLQDICIYSTLTIYLHSRDTYTRKNITCPGIHPPTHPSIHPSINITLTLHLHCIYIAVTSHIHYVYNTVTCHAHVQFIYTTFTNHLHYIDIIFTLTLGFTFTFILNCNHMYIYIYLTLHLHFI